MFSIINMQFYRKEIQIHKNVIDDIFSNFKPGCKMLVFGLGYDSKMWYEGNNKNTFFVENKDEYIKLNEKDIPSKRIIKYDYVGITCENSVKMTDEQISKYACPTALLNEGPFDIILIDGPEGFGNKPGRLIPAYWSAKFLSKPGTLIYVDDSNRKVETYSIQKYFKDKVVKVFPERNNCTKIIINGNK